MSEIEMRLRENYPTILMTLISLIVALVFETLISGMSEQSALGSVTVENFFL